MGTRSTGSSAKPRRKVEHAVDAPPASRPQAPPRKRQNWVARALAAERTVTVLKRRLASLDAGTEKCPIRTQLNALARRTNESAWRRAELASRKVEEAKQAERFAVHDAMYQEFMEGLEGEVRSRTEHIRAILDNVGVGLLLVGRDQKVAPGWSRSCAALLAVEDPTGGTLSAALGLEGGVAADFELGLEQIFDDMLPEELTLAQARSRVQVADRTLGLVYGVVRDAGAVTSILVTVSDVTAQIVAERSAREAKALLAIRTQLPLFRMFVEDARRLLVGARTALALGDSIALRRAVHTIKGNASVHDLESVVRTAHVVESVATIGLEEIDSIEAALDAFLDDHQDVLGPATEAMAQDEVPFSEADLRKLVVSAGGDPGVVPEAVSKRRFVPAGKLVVALESAAQRVASRLDKSIEVIVEGAEVALDARRLSGVLGGLSHLVRNAVDHGLEATEDRAGKPAVGTLILRFEDLPGAWRISVKDDGRGIDPRRIAAAAAAKGIDANPVSVEEAVEVLCLPGFTTAEQLSDISGRGVGLPAVREAVVELGGAFVVRSTIGFGTEFEMLCPKAA